MRELRSGRRVRVELNGPAEAIRLLDQAVALDCAGAHLDFQYAGSLPDLLRWLAELPARDVRIEPMGLANIYQRFHQLSE